MCGQSPGPAGPICNTQFICGAKSSDIYIRKEKNRASYTTRWARFAFQLYLPIHVSLVANYIVHVSM